MNTSANSVLFNFLQHHNVLQIDLYGQGELVLVLQTEGAKGYEEHRHSILGAICVSDTRRTQTRVRHGGIRMGHGI